VKKNVLIVVAHPDDETFGMGGTIAKHNSLGDKVYAISFTDGISSRTNNKKAIARRSKSLAAASKILGFKWLKNFDYDDNKLDKISLLQLVKEIEKIKKKIKFDLIYSHNFSDLNIDHQIISRATLTAFRPDNKNYNPEIRFFEVPSSTDFSNFKINGSFQPNLYVSITKFWKKKINALNMYKQELKKKPHSRSLQGITNLSKIRGNQCSHDYAEAFEIVRKIIK
jgi:LmbE family N-acetylglucosaminyl deacetylase